MKKKLKRIFTSNFLFTFGIIICVFWILASLLAPVLAPYDPIAQELATNYRHPVQHIGLEPTILGGIS